MKEKFTQSVQAAITRLALPASYCQAVEGVVCALAAEISNRHQATGRPIVVGLNGSQGSGKSTVSEFLKLSLELLHNLPTAIMSLDDIYLSKPAREKLALEVHPLLKTRGVPGTHQLSLGLETIDSLINASGASRTLLPSFDKSIDDVTPRSNWRQFQGRAEVLILEGWCVAARAQSEGALLEPVNTLELNEDSRGVWRNYVNAQLESHYPVLFNKIDFNVMLKAPDFDCVFGWRLLQEQKLMAQVKNLGRRQEAKQGLLGEAELKYFLMHYERLTRFMLTDLPDRMDAVIPVSRGHRLLNLELRR